MVKEQSVTLQNSRVTSYKRTKRTVCSQRSSSDSEILFPRRAEHIKYSGVSEVGCSKMWDSGAEEREDGHLTLQIV